MLKIDCGNCGSNNVQLDHDIYRCMSCGKKYTAAEAEQRDQDLKKWDQMRKLQIILLVASFAFMVFASILLPGYASEGSHAALIIKATCICALYCRHRCEDPLRQDAEKTVPAVNQNNRIKAGSRQRSCFSVTVFEFPSSSRVLPVMR